MSFNNLYSIDEASLHDSRQTVFYCHKGLFAEVILNRSERLNALTADMWQRLHLIISSLSQDTTLRCILIKSHSPKAFSAGCDIQEFETIRTGKTQGRTYGKLMHDTLNALRHCPIPVVASIQGVCIGAGLEIASTCDIRLCEENARFGAPIKNLGLVMAYPELSPLLEIVNKTILLDMLLTGRIYNAQEAWIHHLVTRVVPHEKLEQETTKTIEAIISGAPLAARWHKQFIHHLVAQNTFNETDLSMCFDCFDTEDYLEGCNAFKMHRKPIFQGK